MNRLRFVIPALAVGLLIAPAARAQTVSSLVEGNNGGVITSDPQGPSATTAASYLDFVSTGTVFDLARDGYGRAAQEPGGVGAVVADGVFVNGLTGNYIVARTQWVDTATNVGGGPQDYFFDFLIAPSGLRIADYAGVGDASPQRPDVSFSATIKVNGVPVFEASARLVGGFLSHVLTETGTSLGPVAVGGGSVFGYDFSSYSDTLYLGLVPSGASVTVEYEMIARVDTPGYETGGRANFGDPFDLGGNPGFTGSITTGGPVSGDARSIGQIKGQFE